MANAGDVEIGKGLTRAVKCLRPPYDLGSTKEMRGERFARMRGPLLAGACVAALVPLVGCRAHVTPGSPHTTGLITDPLYAHFPPPDPGAWDTKAPPGLEFATCQLASEETEDLLLSFLYRVAKSIDAIDSHIAEAIFNRRLLSSRVQADQFEWYIHRRVGDRRG